MLWFVLIEFIFRLSLGLAACMALTSPRQVNSGFYRVHLWVLLGLGTFGSLVLYSQRDMFAEPSLLITMAITTTVLCYIGSVIWLYEAVRPGMVLLAMIAALCMGILLLSDSTAEVVSESSVDLQQTSQHWVWAVLDHATSSLLLGSTFAAMLLGHWYLNSPTMKLDPLKRLLLLMVVALVARAIICGGGLGLHFLSGNLSGYFTWSAVTMRWLAGIFGLAGMTWMTWQTLKIPNTQSATGILYVALVFVFLGELASSLLMMQSPVPI